MTDDEVNSIVHKMIIEDNNILHKMMDKYNDILEKMTKDDEEEGSTLFEVITQNIVLSLGICLTNVDSLLYIYENTKKSKGVSHDRIN